MTILGNIVLITVVKSIGSVLLGYMAMSLLTLATLLLIKIPASRRASLLPGSMQGLLFDLSYTLLYSMIGGAVSSYARVYGFEPFALTVIVVALGMIYAGDERLRRMKNAKHDLGQLDQEVQNRKEKKEKSEAKLQRDRSLSSSSSPPSSTAAAGTIGGDGGSVEDVDGGLIDSDVIMPETTTTTTTRRRRGVPISDIDELDLDVLQEEDDDAFEARISAQRMMIQQRLTGLPVWFHLAETIFGGLGSLAGHMFQIYLMEW